MAGGGLVAATSGAADAVTATPRLTVGDVSVAEGDAGKLLVKVPVSLDVKAPVKVPVRWQVTGANATPVADFASPRSGLRSGTLYIAAGKTEGFVSITTLGDSAVETAERINVDVLSAPGASIVRSHGTLTLTNDDGISAGATPPRVAVGVPVVWEGNSSVRHAAVPVTLSVPAPAPITVSFATPGSDDLPDLLGDCHDASGATVPGVSQTLTFSTGQQAKTVNLAVTGNTSVGRAFVVVTDQAAVVSGDATIATPLANVVVVDDDGANGSATPPAAGVARVSEPNGGANPTFSALVSDPNNGCGYPRSAFPAVDAAGRFVAFSSNAQNLVGNDTNGYDDVFVKDTWTGDIQRVSVAADGSQANEDSIAESISADGRFVTFSSTASNLVPGDDNSWSDSFLYDRATGAIQRIGSVHEYHAGSASASISADDRYVVFSATSALTGGCSCQAVFLLDRTTNAVSLVSTGPDGQMPSAYLPAISGDGQHVAFIGGTPGSPFQVWVKDLATGALTMVSVNNAGQPGTGTYGTYPTRPALSSDGRAIAFVGQYCNFGLASQSCGTSSTIALHQVWVRDRTAGTTRVASLSSNGTPIYWTTSSPSISADGNVVSFVASNIIGFTPECPQSGPAAGGTHVYTRDLSAGTTQRRDALSATVPCPTSQTYTNQSLSADGKVAVFSSTGPASVSATNPETVYVDRRA
jgi:hypothetical protein